MEIVEGYRAYKFVSSGVGHSLGDGDGESERGTAGQSGLNSG